MTLLFEMIIRRQILTSKVTNKLVSGTPSYTNIKLQYIIFKLFVFEGRQ
jgi:hypothetical protein